MTHLSAADIQALVLGDTPPRGDARRVHLASCPDCARRLAREARVELTLHDAVAASEAPATAQPASRWVLAAAALLTLVLSAGLYVASVRTRSVAPPPLGSTLPPAPDTPCLVDPIVLGRAHDAVAPDVPGLNATATTPRERLDR